MRDYEGFIIIRSDRAGVFFGKIKEREGDVVRLTEARRLWSWSGACSLSQLAEEGVKRPDDCKFTVIVPEMVIFGVIEILPCSEIAIECIKAVKVWKS